MRMHTAFTGTQQGMRHLQREALKQILFTGYLHHGDCIGADEEAHAIACGLEMFVVIHPPDDDHKRAWCRGARRTMPEAPYLVRNHEMVDVCSRLIAAPAQAFEQLRSGTWATVRYALKVGKPVLLIRPDGTLLSMRSVNLKQARRGKI